MNTSSRNKITIGGLRQAQARCATFEMSKIGPLLLTVMTLLSCQFQSDKEQHRPKPILVSDREAPIGWTHFSIYDDNTFNYNHGKRSRQLTGTVEFEDDTLRLTFDHQDEVNFPDWDRAVIKEGRVVFFNDSSLKVLERNFVEFTEINLDEITEKK